MQAEPGGEIGETMDWEEIERLRVEGFTLARRGYDRHEVDKFLGALLDWLETDAAKDLGGAAVKRKLELAGKSTAQILLTTENESEQMRRQTEKECAELRSEAEAAALRRWTTPAASSPLAPPARLELGAREPD